MPRSSRGAAAGILLADTHKATPLARLVYEDNPPLRPALLGPPPPLPANPPPARLDLRHALNVNWPIDQSAHPSSVLQPARFSVKRGRTVMLALVTSLQHPQELRQSNTAFQCRNSATSRR
jgi:hypothetical protein